MRYLISACIVLSSFFSIDAAEISGPNRSDVGRLIILRIDGVDADALAKWAIFPEEYYTDWIEFDNGRNLVFASPRPGHVTFIVAVYSGGKLDVLTHVVDNGGDEPNPEPPSPPVPPPPPDNPFYGVASQAEKLTALSGEELRDNAKKMADAIESVLNDQRAASLHPASFRARVREAVDRALAEDINRWFSFSSEVAKVFEKINPSTTKEHVVAYKKLVDAIRAVILGGEQK